MINKLEFFCFWAHPSNSATMEFSFGEKCVIFTHLKIITKMGNDNYSKQHYRSHAAPIFHKYNILNVYDSYKLEVGVFMYQYFQNLLPSSFKDTVFGACPCLVWKLCFSLLKLFLICKVRGNHLLALLAYLLHIFPCYFFKFLKHMPLFCIYLYFLYIVYVIWK